VDDLVLMAETKEKLMADLLVRKDHMEAKGLRVNVGKTKVMRSAMGQKNQVNGRVQFS